MIAKNYRCKHTELFIATPFTKKRKIYPIFEGKGKEKFDFTFPFKILVILYGEKKKKKKGQKSL